MRESTERQRNRTNQESAAQRETGKARRAIDERCAAARRWIEDDDEAACRGID